MVTVYLDQNKWIDLAKALLRSDAKAEERENAECLQRAVETGRVRFPISEIHLMEAYRVGNRQRRLQLASVFAAFSAGWFIASRQARVDHELDAALTQLFSLPSTSNPQPFDAFAQCFFWAFGETSHLSAVTSIPAARLEKISSSVSPTEALLSYVGFNHERVRRGAVELMKASNQDLIDRTRSRRALTACQTADLRFRAYSAQLFLEVQDKIDAALRRKGKSFQDLRALPAEKITSLVDLVPCWDVERGLAVQVEQQWSRELAGNDVYDTAALTAAIPYCDVVVTEKLWAHLCRSSSLGARYRAKVLTSVFDIAAFIQ